jgi:hypothetical protein
MTGKMWGANCLRYQRTETGCCTTTMLLDTPRSLWGNSWQTITWPLFPTMPARLTRSPLRFLRVPENETPGETAAFFIHWRDPYTIATGTEHANVGRLQLLPKMAKSPGSLYTSPRWLLQRWRWKLGLKLSVHVITSKFSQILGRICRIFPCVFDKCTASIQGHGVAQLVEVLRYNLKGHVFDSWWCHWNFSFT